MSNENTVAEKWGARREAINNLTTDELLNELQIPTGNWKEDITREALYRLLKNKEKK